MLTETAMSRLRRVGNNDHALPGIIAKCARDVDRCNLINQASCTPNKMCRSQLRYARGNAQSRLSLPQL